MSQLDNIVDVTITSDPAPISTTNYGVALILGPTDPGWSDVSRTYTSPASLLTDGYALTDPEYLAAAALYSNAITPTAFLVCPRRNPDSAQTDTFSLGTQLGSSTLTAGTVYSFTVDGTVITYTAQTGDTAQNVLGSFVTQLTALGGLNAVISNAGSNKLLTVTAATNAVSHTYSAISSNLVHASLAQATGVANDLASLTPIANQWYALLTPTMSDADQLQAAAYIETIKKLYIATSDDPANFNASSTSSLAYKVKQAGYARTAVIPSIASAATFPDGCWVGGNLPTTPGSSNWAYSALPGQVPDALTDNQVAGAQANNANVFINVAGANVTLYGTVGSGDYIDNVIFKDWLHSTIQANCFGIIRKASANGKKIPYTNKGAAQIASGVTAAIEQGIFNGGIDDAQPYSVTITDVSRVSAADKANRKCPPIYFECVLAGAINKVAITGVLDI